LKPNWCDPAANRNYAACLKGVEPEDYHPSTGYTAPDLEGMYLGYYVIQGLAPTWKTEAKCCGQYPTSEDCRGLIRRCQEAFDPKFDNKRDEIEENDYEATGYGEWEAETLKAVGSYCNRICSNMDDAPDWCDNVPGEPLLAGEIAAIVLGVFLFLAIVAIVVLVILYVRKRRVGAATSAE
jgi:hypothetical protein